MKSSLGLCFATLLLVTQTLNSQTAVGSNNSKALSLATQAIYALTNGNQIDHIS